jgi:hypothetical protein
MPPKPPTFHTKEPNQWQTSSTPAFNTSTPKLTKPMDQNLINVAATAFSAVIGWILKVVWDAIRNMQSDMKELEKDLHTKYITKDEYSRDILEIKTILMKISDKLDSKVDKR